MRVLWLGAVLGAATVGSGCGDDECVEDLSTDCAPLYSPTYDEVFTRTLAPTCAQPGAACHSSQGRKGGLVFEDADEAYTLLVGQAVVPSDAACSPLVVRLEASDSTVMPPGSPLDPAERCSIIQWIANGAER